MYQKAISPRFIVAAPGADCVLSKQRCIRNSVVNYINDSVARNTISTPVLHGKLSESHKNRDGSCM